MVSKIVEIRDAGTYIPALAVQLGSGSEREERLLASAGFGRFRGDQEEYVVLCKINGGEPCEAHVDYVSWGQQTRTMLVAHAYLMNLHPGLGSPRPKHGGFASLPDGAVIDVEWILGLRDEPKTSDLGVRPCMKS